MASVLIVFDEKSLALSESDFREIAHHNWERGNKKYVYFKDDSCFMIVENDKPKTAIFFSRVNLDGVAFYEISKIKEVLIKNPDLPKDFEQMNSEVWNLIGYTFEVLNEVINYSGNKNQREDYRYCIYDKLMETINYYCSKDRINISSFVEDLEFKFGVID